MTYYIIRNIGDHPIIDDIANYSFKDSVFEKNEKFFIMEPCTDIDYDSSKIATQVYPTKQEAWKVALKDLDHHISHMHKVRDAAFHKALEDGAFAPDKEKTLKFINNLKNNAARDIASVASWAD